MGLFDRFRSAMTGDRYCPPEHLESYRRLANEVYGVQVELESAKNPKARTYLNAARCLRVMGEALLRDAFPTSSGSGSAVAPVTHEQADIWYRQIPDLLVAARQEAAFEGSGRVRLPIHIGERIESGRQCPTSHLAGMRRCADAVESAFEDDLRHARLNSDTFKNALLLYEEARTRRQVGDAIVGSIMDGRHVPMLSHEEAEDNYWQTLSSYLLIAQGLAMPELLDAASVSYQSRMSKLDSDDPWRITSSFATDEIRHAGEWWEAERDLKDLWQNHRITDEEREFQATVEDLLAEGRIIEEGYWFRCPFPGVYRVTGDPVRVIGRTVPTNYYFTWDFGEDGEPGQFVCESSFEPGYDRHY